MTEKQFRFLKYYAIILTVLVGVLIVAAFIQPNRRIHLKEITVEQINVIDEEGRIRVILAGSFPPRRTELAGLLFVNQEGTEAGGLVYSGQKKDGQVSASGTPRLRLIVDSLGDAKINFLDTNGHVFYTIPE